MAFRDAETGHGNGVRDWPCQMAATRQPTPQRVQPVLPFAAVCMWRQAMLQKQQAAAGAQHPPHFLQGAGLIGDAAQSECADDGVETAVGKRQVFGMAGLDGEKAGIRWRHALMRQRNQLRTGIDARDRADPLAIIKRQIGAATGPQFQHLSGRQRNDPGAPFPKLRTTAGIANQMRHHMPVPPVLHGAKMGRPGRRCKRAGRQIPAAWRHYGGAQR